MTHEKTRYDKEGNRHPHNSNTRTIAMWAEDDVLDLIDATIGQFDSDPAGKTYPHTDGDFIVIGPECFADFGQSVVCWRGENYYLRPQNRLRRLVTRVTRGAR